ncbi:hypothetical protein COU80_02730 [Candidatus Peregrinibacteria bacterium CG10_big_fil_rev_8_21_14_0_10_55_24]|nr:MAG: hypothetical protein COU80_02730 [Candidatus Peregrinibacteria bacterium CG10_big_fil_rev_8_21_14_0_10_55_24]
MQQICANAWCKQIFEITDEDLAFYDKVSPVFGDKKEQIPPPTLCPQCRSQRRMAFRNERNLYSRKCGLSQEGMVSIYSLDKPFPVYGSDAWYGDGWDPLSFGREIQWDQPFFVQYQALQRVVPRLGLIGVLNENCSFANHLWHSRNVYLSFDMGFCEDVLYSYATYHSQNLIDCAFSRNCELSSNLLDCTKCYQSSHLQDCEGCQDVHFSFDCHQCNNIAFCWNLRGKKNHVFNKPVSAEEFQAVLQDIRSGSFVMLQKHLQAYTGDVLQKAIRKAHHNLHCEDCRGDYLLHSRRIRYCFDCETSDDLAYCNRMDEKIVSSMDLDNASAAELAYEGTSIAGHRISFCNASYDISNSNLLYCDTLIACTDCFGCIGLKRKQHCILNKQYTKEEYEALVPKIIEHMQQTKEWGEFFPVEFSPLAYNETVAQEYFPLTKEEVLQRGWKWRDQKDEISKVEKVIPAAKLPDSIEDIPDDILNWAIECEATKRPFRIVKQELDFYRKMRLPIPHFHPDERHRRRMALRNPRRLWKRPCGKCGKEMETTYGRERTETVYCEACYLKEVY